MTSSFVIVIVISIREYSLNRGETYPTQLSIGLTR